MKNQLIHLSLVFAATVVLTGCTSTQSTRFHVAVADVDVPDPELKFYRVTIRAKSSNVKATLHTGFYDANAVRQLYGEVQKGDSGIGAKGKVGTHQFVFDPATR